jgi:hypothetical protein
MSIKYNLSEYNIIYSQELSINAPLILYNELTNKLTDENNKLTDELINKFILSESYNDLIVINEKTGCIKVDSTLFIGVYVLNITYNILSCSIKIIVKPSIIYKITSFYNKGPYNNFSPIINPSNILCDDINYFKLENCTDNILINSKNGIISFKDTIIADTYNLSIVCSIKNIELTIFVSFNIYPIINYKNSTYFSEKINTFYSDEPIIYPLGGIFKFINDYSGIYIDKSTGIINTNNPKSGNYNLTINYKYNNVSINNSLELSIKPNIIYEKSLINYNELISLNIPTISDIGGIFTLDNTNFNKNLGIQSSTGKITIVSVIPSGLYNIKVWYLFNNYNCDFDCEFIVSPILNYNSNKIELYYGTKDQTEIPYSSEKIDGTFTLLNNIENIFINPTNGILYFNSSLQVNEYLLDINYNKNNVNKALQLSVKVKPTINIKIDNQKINYFESLEDIIVDTTPNGGILLNNLNIDMENNIIKLSTIEKNVGEYSLRIKYIYNNIFSSLTYNFIITPYIYYNKNIINLLYKQTFISDIPTVYPPSGIFNLDNKNKYIQINEHTGELSIKSGLSVGNYDLTIIYTIDKLYYTAYYKITINPSYNITNNIIKHEYNPSFNVTKVKLDKINIDPLGGTFESDLFEIDSQGCIIIPSNLEVNNYIINIKYFYKEFCTELQYNLEIFKYNLKCIFKQQPKIYDGTINVKLKYLIPNNIIVPLTYNAYYTDKNVSNNNIIFIKNIQVNNNFLCNDTEIIGFIKPLKLEISFVGISKIYDGTTTASVDYIFTNLINDDEINIISYNAVYDNYNVGLNKIIITNIILDGIDKKNYYVDNIYEISGKIIPANLILNFNTPIHIYNNSTKVNLEILSISGLIINDKIKIESYEANFISSDVGENIPILVSKIKIFKNNNYYISNTELVGEIIQKNINLNLLCIDKIYDGTNEAFIKILDTNFTLISYEALYENKNAGFKKTVYIKNIKITNTNYLVNNININGNILPLVLNAEFIGEEKIYDGTNKINGTINFLNKIENDDISISTNILFANSNAETDKILNYSFLKLTGKDYNNYRINKLSLNKCNIKKKRIEIEFIGINKIYDNTDEAQIKVKNINGKINNDNIKIHSYKAIFENKNVGINKKIIITNIQLINGFDNYYCEDTYTTANIEKKIITLTIETLPKEYDGTINANIKLLDLKGLYFNDNLFVVDYKSEFLDFNIGANKTINIYDIILGGIDKDNYICNNFTKKSNIIKKKINITSNNLEKIYDGKTSIILDLYINNLVNDDSITIKSYNANFEDSKVGDFKKIYITNIKLEGLCINNYSICEYVIYGNIKPAYLDLEFKIYDKIFDKTTSANINILNKNLVIKYEAYYEDILCGNNKKIIVTIKEYTVENYILKDTYIIYGNILPKNISLEYDINDKVFDNTLNHDIKLYSTVYNINILDYTVKFENINIGSNKKIYIDNIILDDTNYKCENFLVYGNIIPKPIILECIIKQKQFDFTNKVLPITFINSYNINIISYEAIYNSINSYDENLILISNIKLNNNNYCVNNFSVKSEILQKEITIKIILDTKEYDGNNLCTIKNYEINLKNNQNIKILSYEAFFINEKIGIDKIVNIKNIKLSNNNFYCNDLNLFSTITKKILTIKFKNIVKIYDKTTNIDLEIDSINGIINNDNIYIEEFTSILLNYKVGNTQLSISNVKIAGVGFNNYLIKNYFIQTEIIQKKLEYKIIVIDKKYDSTIYALINIIFTNIIKDDDVYLEHFIAKYEDPEKGFNKKIIINELKLNGIDKNNYTIDNIIIINGNII